MCFPKNSMRRCKLKIAFLPLRGLRITGSVAALMSKKDVSAKGNPRPRKKMAGEYLTDETTLEKG